MSRVFEARYGGTCGACQERLHEGDPVRYDDDQLIHDACTQAAQPERPARPVCPNCWLVTPCDCDR